MARVERFGACLIAMLLVTVPVGIARAQSPSPSATPAIAARVLAPGAALDAAVQAATLVDAGRAGELWDGASPVAKRAVTREAFIAGITAARQRHGTLADRQWLSVSRQFHDGKQGAPAGHYVSVELLARASAGRSVRELVSLRIDEDGTARLSGYVVE